MANELGRLPERVGRVEQKVDVLTASVDARFDGLARSLEARFEAVDQSFGEQRQYTELAFTQLRAQVHERFDTVDVRFDRLERKVEWIIDHLTGEKS